MKIGMQHWVLEYYQVRSNDVPGMTLTCFMPRSNLVPYGQTLAGYKAGVRCFLEPPMEEADLVVEQPGGGSSKGETQVL